MAHARWPIIFVVILKVTWSCSLSVMVTKVTTSSVALEWESTEKTQVSYLSSASDKTEVWEVVSLSNQTNDVNIKDLQNNHTYVINVTSGGEAWSSKVTTASCPAGWSGYEMICYLASNNGMSRENATKQCSSFSSAHLADPKTSAEIQFIGEILAMTKKEGFSQIFYWIGVHDKDNDGDFTYSSGLSVTSSVSDFWEKCSRHRLPGADCFALWPDSSTPHSPYCAINACAIYAGYLCQYPVMDSPPTVVIVTTSHQANISWNGYNELYASDVYDVAVISRSGSIWTNTTQQASVVASNLHPGHLYSATVTSLHHASEHDVTSGGRYPPAYFATKPLPPRDVNVDHVTPTSAVVRWSFPAPTESNIYHGFVIAFHSVSETSRATSSAFTSRGKIVVSNVTNTIVLNNLEPLVTFLVTVAATSNHSTTMGEVHSVSDIMDSVVFETPVSPPQSFQTAEVSTTELRVIWEDAIGSPDGYIITLVNSKNDTRKVYKFQKDTNHTSFNGLVPGEEYVISIMTYQQLNQSAPDVIHQRTRPLPVAPQQVIVLPSLTSLSITINRYHPKESIFDGYMITLESEDPPEKVNWFIKKNESMWWDHDVIEGLTPGRVYQVIVRATSGEIRSVPVRIPPITTILAPPTNLRLKSRDVRYLRLEWDAAPGDFDHYIVTCEGDSGVNCSSQFMEVAHGLDVTFEDLLPGALYHFTVEAQDRKMRSEESHLSIRTLPESPSDLRIETRDHSSVTLSWMPADHVLTGYKIDYVPQQSGFYSEALPSGGSVNVPLDGTSRIYVVVDNLMAGILYDFTVMTMSDKTESKSRHISTSTRPLPVDSMKVLEVGETWALITWLQGRGAALYFKVSLQDDRGNIESTRLSANMTSPSYNQTSLLPSSLNYFTVETVSVQDVSSKLGVSIRTRPLPPTSVAIGRVTETSFQMKWNFPESESDRFVIELYIIQEQAESVATRKIFNKEASATLDELTEGSVYYVEVKSEFHDIESYPVQLEVTLYPNPPPNLEVMNVTTSELLLMWETPTGTNGGYRVEWEPHHGKVVLADHTATLSELTPGQEYSINVYTLGANLMKRSRSSAYVVRNTLEAPPGSPDDVDIISTSNSSITVRWKPPKLPNGKILQYVIYYQQLFPHPPTVPLALNVSGNSKEADLEDLEPGAGYYITIAAENSVGIGDFSVHRFMKSLDGTPGIVDDLIATANSSSSIVVSWQPPKQPNGEITLYQLLVENDHRIIVDEFEFHKRKNSNPFKCVFDGASDAALSSLLMLYEKKFNCSVEPINSSTSLPDFEYDKETIQKYLYSHASQKINGSVGNSKLDESEVGDKHEWAVDLNKEDFEVYCPVHFTILGLEPYTKYHVTVRAWTSAGEGEKAAGVTTVTKQEVPGGPTKFLHVFQTHPRNVTVAWAPPYPPNGILSYTLFLYSKDHSEDQMIATNHTRMTIKGLHPYTNYAVTVQAKTEVGVGPWSSILFFPTAEDVPEAVQNLSATVDDSRSVTVSWLQPLHPHGVIISYHVNVYDVTRDIHVYQLITNIVKLNIPQISAENTIAFDHIRGLEESISLPQLTMQQRESELGTLPRNHSMTLNTHQLTKLVPFTNYSIAVAAMTSAGKGVVTETTVLTKEDIPTSPPHNLAYTNLSSTSVNITWDKPLEHNGVITSYTVGIARNELVKKVATSESIVIDGLEVYTPYEVYVWPWTAIGEGPSSRKMLIHTDEDVPGSPPREVKYHNHSSTVIEVFWKTPLTKNGVIINYIVYVDNGKTRRQETSNTTHAVLEGLDAYSSYNVTVSADTRAGEGPESAAISVHTMEGQPTSPPYNLSYKNLSSRSVKLKWSKPVFANGIITFYDVKVEEDDDLKSLRKIRTLDQSQALVITSLRPFTRYVAKVSANTKYGDGAQESDPIIIWTMEDVPESAPHNLSYVNVTSSSILMKWSSPNVPNGVLTSYKISYWPSKERNKEISLNVSSATTQHTFDKLMKYTRYEFTVAAGTRAGYGPKGHMFVITDEDVPSSPPYDVIYKQLSSTSILLSWKPPIYANGVILGYTIYYNNLTRVFQDESFHSNITLENLKKFGKYETFVKARTRFGDGDQKSRKISFETLEDAPSDPPYNVSAEALSSTSLNVSWQPPENPNGHIQFYTIFYRTDHLLTRSVQTTDQTSFKLHGLEKYTRYTVWVTASTALGDGGHRSLKVNATTLEDAPDRSVANLTAWSLNSSSIHLVWSIALPITGPTFSVVEVEDVDQNQSVVYSANIDEEAVTISGLLPYTTYRVTVTPRVYGVDGVGPIRQIYVTTGQDKPTSSVQNLLIVNVTSSSSFLEWASPKQPNGIITSYHLFIDPSGVVLEVPGNITFVNVTGLSPFTTYNVTIGSQTVIGRGPTTITEVATLQGAPSDPPQNVKIYNVTETSALVSWSPPLQPNGILTRYTIEYQPMDAKYDGGVVETDAVQRAVELRGLSPYLNYSLSVRAETEGGMGHLSSGPSIFTTLESVPGPPRNLTCAATSEHHVLISWIVPYHVNGVLKKYTLDYQVPDSGRPALHIDADSMKNTAGIDNLAPYSNYTIQVKGVTTIGGGVSAHCQVRTMQGYPGPPTELQVMNDSSQSLAVTWQPPLERNGVITRYSVVYFPFDGCHENGGSIPINQTDEEMQCEIDVGIRLLHRISYLRYHAEYVVSVKAATSKGFGSLVHPGVKQRTSEGVPEFPPRNVHAVALSSTSANVTWDEPFIHSGMTRYQVVATRSKDGKMSQSNILATNQRHFVITELSKYSTYEVTVAAVTSAGSLASAPFEIETLEDAPGDVPRHINVTVVTGNSSTANIMFNAPLHPNGRIVTYTIQYYSMEREPEFVTLRQSSLQDVPFPGHPYSWYVNNLYGGKEYRFRMRASTKVGHGSWSQWSELVVLPITAPPPPKVKPEILKGSNVNGGLNPGITSSSFTVRSPCVFSEVNGPIQDISIVVVEEGADRTKEPINWKQAYVLRPSPPYNVIVTSNFARDCPMASKTNNETSRNLLKRSLTSDKQGFVVGADNSCGDSSRKFCNGALKPDTVYRVKYRAATTNGEITDTEYSEPIRTDPNLAEANTNLIIGIVVPVLVFLIVLVASLIFMKRRRGHSIQKPPESDFTPDIGIRRQRIIEEESQNKTPIVETCSNTAFVEDHDDCLKVAGVPVSRQIRELDFEGHVTSLALHKNKGFSNEFDDIRGLPIIGTTASADKACNRTKNRFSKLVPFDQFRVQLNGTSSIEGSDYINASYLPGQHSVDQFIATQNPLDHTKKDFWKMMWERGSTTIAMLGTDGKGKTKREEVFWPQKKKKTEYFGSVSVELIRENHQPDWTIVHLVVHEHDQSRNVTIFHMTNWQVSDTQRGAQVLLMFVDAIRLGSEKNDRPLVVVCSSGSGISGVFISLHRMLEALGLKSHVDCFGEVAAMRRYRPYMIQTVGEYILLHRCMLEAITTRLRKKRPPTGDGMEETIF